jgi:hypothetical protein
MPPNGSTLVKRIVAPFGSRHPIAVMKMTRFSQLVNRAFTMAVPDDHISTDLTLEGRTARHVFPRFRRESQLLIANRQFTATANVEMTRNQADCRERMQNEQDPSRKRSSFATHDLDRDHNEAIVALFSLQTFKR